MTMQPAPATPQPAAGMVGRGGTSGARIDQATPFTGSGGGGPSGGGPSGGGPFQAPTVSLSGGGIAWSGGQYTGVVGGAVNVIVSAPTDPSTGLLESVTFSVSGALSGQNYSWAEGTSPTTTGQTTMAQGNLVAPFAFNEDNTTGNHPVTVVAHYQNGDSAPTTINVNVVQPTVSFQGDYQPFTFGSLGTTYGLSLGNGYIKPGIEFSASVATPAQFGGQFAIIQLTQMNRAVTANNIPYTQKSGGYVLDNPYGFTEDSSEVTYAAYVSQTFAPNTTGPVPTANYQQNSEYPDVTGVIVDSPFVAYFVQNNNPAQTTWTSISINDSFQTYLAYKSTGGVWIGLSQIPWSISGTITIANGQWSAVNPPGLSPSNGGTFNGNNQTSLINWSNSANPYSPNTNYPGVGTFWSPTPPPQN
jgi:hypothetical protein